MKRMKVGWMAALAVLAGAVMIAPAIAAEQAAKKADESGAPALMTQGELAQLLVKKLGLLNVIGKANPTAVESIDALVRYNIIPSMAMDPAAAGEAGGWSLDPKAFVQEPDLIVLLVRALGLTGQVTDPTKLDSWKKVLSDVQIPYSSSATAVAQMVPLTEIIAAIPVRASTPEPLTKVYVPSSEGLNVISSLANGGTVKFMDLSVPTAPKPTVKTVPVVTVPIANVPPPKKPVTPNTSKANSEV